MFPSTHDIFPENIDACAETLRALLERGNKVLIVSKPRFDVIPSLLDGLDQWRDQVLLRFTIGTLDAGIAKTWEPDAPSPFERLRVLRYAHSAGWKTSVSMEPMLNPLGVVLEFYTLAPLVTDGIWLGLMNKIGQRVRGVAAEKIEALRAAQCDDNIRRIYNRLRLNEKVRWKESVKRVVGLPLETEAGVDR